MNKTFAAIFSDADNYDERRVSKTEVSGFIISTAFTSDAGYETAIIDREGTHPVERYPDRNSAVSGHQSWVSKITNGLRNIIKLGDVDGWLENEPIRLQPQ